MTGGPDASTDIRTRYKREAAERAVEFVESGMIVGLGTGSTAIFAIRRIGALLGTGALERHRRRGHILEHRSGGEAARDSAGGAADGSTPIDMTIDGADEVDPALNLIKGGGGALLREKIVAQTSRRVIIVVDDCKLSPGLGTRPLPVEVIPFGWRSQAGYLKSLGAPSIASAWTAGAPRSAATRGTSSSIARPDRSNDPGAGGLLQARAGVVAHGLFLGLATDVIVAGTRDRPPDAASDPSFASPDELAGPSPITSSHERPKPSPHVDDSPSR